MPELVDDALATAEAELEVELEVELDELLPHAASAEAVNTENAMAHSLRPATTRMNSPLLLRTRLAHRPLSVGCQ